jgi:hypothetical protein
MIVAELIAMRKVKPNLGSGGEMSGNGSVGSGSVGSGSGGGGGGSGGGGTATGRGSGSGSGDMAATDAAASPQPSPSREPGAALPPPPPSRRSHFMVRSSRTLFEVDIVKLRASAPDDAPPSFVELGAQCCSARPEDRPTADDACGWMEDLEAELALPLTLPPARRPNPSEAVLERRRELVRSASGSHERNERLCEG